MKQQMGTFEAGNTAAFVFANFVDAGSIVLTAVILTVVHVLFAPHTFEPRRTFAPEAKYFEKYFEKYFKTLKLFWNCLYYL